MLRCQKGGRVMRIQRMPHYTDSMLTQEMAREDMKGDKVVIAWYTNHENKQSVVHSHPYYEIVLPIKGSEVHYFFSGKTVHLHTGEMIFLPVSHYHSGKYDVTEPISERLVIQIDAGIWNVAMAHSGLGKPSWQKDVLVLDVDTVCTWDLRGLFERMAQATCLDDAYRETILQCELVELQLLIEQSVVNRQVQAPNATSALVGKAVDYLEFHYTDPRLTVAGLAQYTYTSREHLSRVFKEYTMESVHGYLTNLRMQHCRRAIADGKSVLDACLESGFSNYSSFLKSFRSMYGITPAEYRAQLKALKKSRSTKQKNQPSE